MIPLSLTAVAYMSVTTFICDDYTTCLKIIKLINCITHVMMILGPCRNNAFFLSNKFQAGTAKFALFFHVCTCCACYVAHMLHICFLIVVGRKMQIDTVLSKMK